MWYVGLDWADTHHDVDVLDEAGKRVGARRFAHSHEGLNELKQFVLSIAASPENLACIVETNHGLLITFLLEAGIPVYPVNATLPFVEWISCRIRRTAEPGEMPKSRAVWGSAVDKQPIS